MEAEKNSDELLQVDAGSAGRCWRTGQEQLPGVVFGG